jgi:vacuolar-type H+-ATPase subunit H
MEELQSTDVLDKEILEDARKKARRILKTADETVAVSGEKWETQTRQALDTIRQTYAQRTQKSREEIMARLPLDKRRIYSEKVETLLHSAMGEYLGGLPREKLLSLLETELRLRAGELPEPGAGSPPVSVGCRALSEAELTALLSGSVPETRWILREDFSFHALPGTFPAIVVDAPSVRITASLDALAESLLEDSRAELVAALLGPSALLGPDVLPEPPASQADGASEGGEK